MSYYLNELEMSPFSRKGHTAIRYATQKMKQNGVKNTEEIESILLDESSFFKNFYVEPLTRFCSDEIDIEKENDINFQKTKEILVQNFKKFENNLNSDVTNTFWLYGPAGCGKTTYLYDLKHRLKNNNISINDFEDIKRKAILKYKGSSYKIGEQKLWEKHNCYKFCLLIIEGIFKILKLEEVLNSNDYTFLRQIIEYSDKLGEQLIFPEEPEEFFELLSNLAYKTNEKNLTEFIDFFKNLINVGKEYETIAFNICQPIKSLIHILSYLLVLTGNINKKREIFIFDNIEYYIRGLVDPAGHKIPDKTIEIILQSIIQALEEELGDFLDNDIKFIPSFIIATRPATVAFNLNGHVNNQYSIDITKWFWAKEIYEKKINFINQYSNSKDKKLYDLFLNLLGDCTTSSWSLGIFLPRLFNYDYRRLCRVTLDSLKVGFLYSSKMFDVNYNRFTQIWKKAQEPKGKNFGTRHLCRLYIIRMLLDEFNKINQFGVGENENTLFGCLKFDCNEFRVPKLTEEKVDEIITNCEHYEKNEYSSYVRKVLNVLHCFEIEIPENQIRSVNYMTFESLLKEMFLSGGCNNAEEIEPERLRILSSILYIMNEYSDKANWGQLTTIKWNHDAQNYNSDSLYKILYDARENIILEKEDDVRFGIKINPAGQAFLKILPEFEFFDLRYCEDLPSLFTDEGMKKKEGWIAEQIIDRVLYNSLYCCNEVIKRDYSFFASFMTKKVDFNLLYSSKFIYHETSNNYSNLPHPSRILDQQSNYLRRYREFVDALEPNEKRFKNSDEKTEFLKMIDSKIALYKYCDKKYKEKYPKYFNYNRSDE